MGALVGRAEYSKIKNCTNAYCYVSANENAPGFIGSVDDNTYIINCASSTPTPNQIAINNNDLDNPAGDKNTDRISALYSQLSTLNSQLSLVVLPGRVLYKDGCWNTLCLPFSLTAEEIAASPLAGAILKEFDRENTNFNATTGTLNINFKDATSIVAGTPYLIKWTKPDGYVSYDYYTRHSDDIMNPEFPSVLIDNSADAQNRMTVTSTDGKVSFKGTYSVASFVDDKNRENKSVLFLGTYVDKKTTLSDPSDDEYYCYLYYPKFTSSERSGRVQACRAYFQLNGLTVGSGSNNVRAYNIDFGEDNEVDGVNEVNASLEVNDDSWYSLDGRKLQGKPAKDGIYIHNGRKEVLKYNK